MAGYTVSTFKRLKPYTAVISTGYSVLIKPVSPYRVSYAGTNI